LALGDTIRAAGHLFVLCSDPEPDGSVVGFNLTENDFDTDPTCPVHIGEHPYVRKESVIAYNFGDLFPPKRIERLRLLESQNYGPVSQELLVRIQHGALESKATPPHLKKIIERTLAARGKAPAS